MLLLGPQVLPHVLHVCEPGVRGADPTAHPQLAPTLQILPLVRLLPVRLRWEGCTVHLPGQLLPGPEAAGPWLFFVEASSQAGEDGMPVCHPGRPLWAALVFTVGPRLLGLVFPGCQVLDFREPWGASGRSAQLKSQGCNRCHQAVPAHRAHSGWRSQLPGIPAIL